MRISSFVVLSLSIGVLASACASTRVTFTPDEPPAYLCRAKSENSAILVLWATQWRPDQKDIPLREVAAEQGITHFFNTSGCYAQAEIRKTSAEELSSKEKLERLINSANSKPDRVLIIVVHELGPVVKLFSSLAFIDGGTEVVLSISEYGAQRRHPSQTFSVRWENGGPGIIKGVESLPEDMEAALIASLKPNTQ
ncbi:hypothetical protein COW36_17110 [bacterium (Candidatus Blackallbacteria) CG17_big_fil_post_rev_8_21_14_2_50_48_46]|uniref:Lipoprotein n=1 Tax=bacterium (Candidatus Blackallbacteria) CG17_big_fil_post_rev_8_21_14_2_50_48_46 TaxID=2014261 RepID=A0A2M7G1V3_9BACT|nr:MAG: hypothetical protein COW64_09420 [bacterium (Candidatus Blackallbacteria) CG18_big_fil_WC_8_21_14_2_50_49_26]PIW15521.1 MAG: hypothetical protein COW36_17110 [bacterium (Candidatus Blackallbacteria) CG17_big_fil_post_rev_8_21_14_2_50_48_46]PIW48578.1 MAG: hypothetical protein COW20_08730 [bacterium (Candidatus Blackallbacteria) CG13_big_fil_rev_8_21_14_2_50_49_14]